MALDEAKTENHPHNEPNGAEPTIENQLNLLSRLRPIIRPRSRWAHKAA